MASLKSWMRRATAVVACSWALSSALASAQAAVGVSEIAATAQDGPVTVFYPTAASTQTIQRGPFSLNLMPQAEPVRGNGRLVVLSHGSGGGPWVHADLATALVQAGFVVAMPQHRGDNNQDPSRPGPDSWSQRPAEVSRAIDAVGRDARLAPLLDLSRVGMYGMSAGGHTALELAGGQWSPASFRDHCQAHLRADFQTCVGLATRLTGSWLDSVRLWAAPKVIAWKFDDATPRQHVDARIVAIVAGVPLAADFDMATLAQPRVPLGLVTAQQDRWLIPRFHSDRVLQACLPRCEQVADLPTGGHGALLSPLPPGFTGLVADLLNDPAGFDRALLPEVDRKIVAFFGRHMLGQSVLGQSVLGQSLGIGSAGQSTITANLP
jgi:predicted dienelactone hydrolase